LTTQIKIAKSDMQYSFSKYVPTLKRNKTQTENLYDRITELNLFKPSSNF